MVSDVDEQKVPLELLVEVEGPLIQVQADVVDKVCEEEQLLVEVSFKFITLSLCIEFGVDDLLELELAEAHPETYKSLQQPILFGETQRNGGQLDFIREILFKGLFELVDFLVEER